jgi:hypothetical protein
MALSHAPYPGNTYTKRSIHSEDPKNAFTAEDAEDAEEKQEGEKMFG